MNWSEIFEYKDGDLVWKERRATAFKTMRNYSMWRTRFLGKVAGCIHEPHAGRERYIRVRFAGKIYCNHRVIWEIFNGPIPQGMEIDHIDGNGLNNRIENLRCVIHSTNCKNLPKRVDNTSGSVGVTWGNKERRWIAVVGNRRIGAFRELPDAIVARKREEKAHGYHENHGR